MAIFKFFNSKNPFSVTKGHHYAMRMLRYAPSTNNNYEEPLAVDLINIEDQYKDCWGDIMDNTRAYWNDINNYHSNDQVCYRHYVLSPNPVDNITLEEFRDYVKEYCERVYEGRFEIAVVYHNDNKNHIMHAHLYINTPVINKEGLVQGTNYLSTFFKNENYPGRFQWHMALREHMAEERGWHNFLEKQDEDLENQRFDELGIEDKSFQYWSRVDDEKERETVLCEDKEYFLRNYYYNPDKEYKTPSDKLGISPSGTRYSSNDNYYSSKEKRIIMKYGTSYNELIREKIEIAKRFAKNESEYIENIKDLGLLVKENKHGEYVYSFKNECEKTLKSSTYSIQGKRLGKLFTKNNVLAYISKKNNLSSIDNTEQAGNCLSFDDLLSNMATVVEKKTNEFVFERYKIDTNRFNFRYSKREIDVINKYGWSKNEDIRQRVSCAIDESYDELSFIYQCNKYDIDVEITSNNDYKFHHPDKDVALAVTGERLGGKFKKCNILEKFGNKDEYVNTLATTKATQQAITTVNNRQAFFSKMKNLGVIKDEKNDVFVHHASDADSKITPKDVINMLKIKDKFNIHKYEDLINLMRDSSSKDKAELQFAQDVLLKLGNVNVVKPSIINTQKLDFSKISFCTPNTTRDLKKVKPKSKTKRQQTPPAKTKIPNTKIR